MKIKLNDIPREGLTREVEYGGEILEGLVPVREPILVKVKIERSGRNARVKGDIKAKLLLSCSRCLADFEWEVTDQFDFLLMLPSSAKGRPEVELAAEELDVSFFDGETVDIAQIATEQIFLQMPLKPLCQEECKGLCPRCGANLNLKPCGCPPEATSSPFEVLKNIRSKK